MPQELTDLRSLATEYTDDLFLFCRDVIGFRDMHAPYHRDVVCRFLTTWKPGKNIKVLLVPRRHLKSSIASVAMPLWLWARDPDTRILLSHGKRETGVKYLRETKWHLQHNALLPLLWPDVFFARPHKESPVWHVDEFNVIRPNEDKVPSILAAGVDSSVVGLHFNLIIFDDLVFRENVGTPDMRAKTLQYLQESLALLRPNGRCIILGTRWHWDDMYSALIDPHGPYRDTVDALVTGSGYLEGEPVFPLSASEKAGFTMEMLEYLRETMRDQFWAQYENSPREGDSGIFARADMKMFDLTPVGEIPTDRSYQFFTAVDPNRSIQTKDDPCVVLTAAVDEAGHIWVVDISRGHPTGLEIVQWIRSHVQRWKPIKVIVEANNFQLQLSHWLREDQLRSGILYPIQEVVRGPTTKKYDRITAMQPLVQAGGLHVRRGFDALISEMEHYPTWKHDDQCDALADIFAYGYRANPRKTGRGTPSSPFLLKNILDDLLHGGSADRTVRRFS